MTPPSNAGGEGREVLAREVLAEHAERHGYPLAAASIRRNDDPWFYTVCARAMLAFSARENADDRAPALVEVAVAEGIERRRRPNDTEVGRAFNRGLDAAMVVVRSLAATPSQEASNVG